MKKIITISRQFGSGGHEIAKKLAEKTNFKMYDNELILEIANNTKLSAELIKYYDEKPITKTFLPFKTNAISIIDKDMPLEKQIFMVEKEIMISAAKNDDCIFVGRCANYIFKDYENSIHFYIYSDIEDRIKRKMQILKLPYKDVKRMVVEQDQKRLEYYKANTNLEWGNKDIYDVCINTSLLSIDEVVDMIAKIIN